MAIIIFTLYKLRKLALPTYKSEFSNFKFLPFSKLRHAILRIVDIPIL